MKAWLDAKQPRATVRWLSEQFELEVVAVRDLGLVRAKVHPLLSYPRGWEQKAHERA